ncbi:MAG: papd-like protein [Polaromonas sp.]|nr:papd-like protein [Polaromonas sp.]
MKKLFSMLCAVLLFAAALAGQPAAAQTGPKTLIVYDGPPGTQFAKLGLAYSIMLKNLIGHFDSNAELLPVQNYVAGKMQAYDAIFYMGAYYDNPLPAAFLTDVMATPKTVVWFKYNLWQLAWNSAYGFQAKFGMDFSSLRGLNAAPTAANPSPGFFDTIGYKSKSFVKYYAFNGATGAVAADPDIGVTTVLNAAKASVVVPVTNPKTGETAPYVMRSGNFWYVADMPFSFIGPRDRYLVLSDLLHDMLGVNHAESHKALVRLEDVGAMVSVSAMKTLTDYLYGKRVPFSIAMIPRYMDPLGTYNGGVAQTVPLSQATNLKTSVNYALARGAEVVMHGYTHQYSSMKNPHTGVSGDDYEFWNIVANSPVAEDSTAWALGRLNAGKSELASNGYTPVAWETPHYHASALTSKVTPQAFSNTYQRVVYFTADKPNFNAATNKDFGVGQIFPYVIKKDYYGQRIIPESLGNIEYDIRTIDPSSNFNYTWQDIVTNAEYGKTVRDGYASFFFHPFWLEPEVRTPGFADFQKVMDGITNLGYTWIAPSAAQ